MNRMYWSQLHYSPFKTLRVTRSKVHSFITIRTFNFRLHHAFTQWSCLILSCDSMAQPFCVLFSKSVDVENLNSHPPAPVILLNVSNGCYHLHVGAHCRTLYWNVVTPVGYSPLGNPVSGGTCRVWDSFLKMYVVQYFTRYLFTNV